MTSDTSAVADAYTAMQTLCAGQYPDLPRSACYAM
jgi:hypothetical protein